MDYKQKYIKLNNCFMARKVHEKIDKIIKLKGVQARNLEMTKIDGKNDYYYYTERHIDLLNEGKHIKPETFEILRNEINLARKYVHVLEMK